MTYYFPDIYSIPELSDAGIYRLNSEIKRLANTVVAPVLAARDGISTYRARAIIASGDEAILVKKYFMDEHNEFLKHFKTLKDTADRIPSDYKLYLDVTKRGCRAALKPNEYHSDLNERLKRIGAHWDGQSQKNRCLWVIPLNKIKGVPKIINNHKKEFPSFRGGFLKRPTIAKECQISTGDLFE